jgi:putative NIF3 family GTP cyclohydrolase 1 type 2
MSDITALQLIKRILGKTGAPGRPQTLDYVSAGDPTRTVTGIAVMGLASLDGMKSAAASGANLVITYDPAFWSTNDDLDHLETDVLFVEKRDLIRSHDIVVFNLHDHWQDRMPDGIATGMAQTLGWQAEGANANLFRRPPTALLALAQELGAKLDDKTLRVVGDPKLSVTTMATSFGNTAQMPGIALLNSPADVVICGYAHEWEVVEYAQDMIATGAQKGLILLGENASVQAGMRYCADWIKTFVTEVPVSFLSATEPYWTT